MPTQPAAEIRGIRERYLLDLAHVNELIRECGWRPPSSFHMPPKHPRR